MSFSYKHSLFLILFISSFAFSQSETSTWKAQIAFGINSPNSGGFVNGFEAKTVNFPTINLGVQRMFTKIFGAKLDLGYNRLVSESGPLEIKTNYSRVNIQLVYDATNTFTFLPEPLGFVAHAGPGLSFIKPLNDFGNNKHSLFNVMAGFELHYNVDKTFSIYTDVSYILGFGKDETHNPITNGFGTFNGNLLTVTVGVSLSLSGCYYCE